MKGKITSQLSAEYNLQRQQQGCTIEKKQITLADGLNQADKPSEDRLQKGAGTGCDSNKEYYNIIYLPNERQFWLIKEDTANLMAQAEDKFKTAVAIADPEKRLEALSERQITQLFVTPELLSFLSEEDKATYHRKEEEIYRLSVERKNKAVIESTQRETMTNQDLIMAINTPSAEENRLTSDLRSLDQKAKEKAKSLGYTFVGSQIYSQTQIKVDELLKQYDESQQKMQNLLASDTMGSKDIFESITKYQQAADKILEQNKKQTLNDSDIGIISTLYENQVEVRNRTSASRSHIELIIKLADFGIAVAEFAFCPQNAQQGIINYTQYLAKIKERKKVEDKLNKEFKIWATALGSKASLVPPQSYEEYVTQIQIIDADLKQKHTQAEKNVENLGVPMLCMWDVSKFRPQPVDFLFKAVMPLQEYSTPISKNAVYQLSHLAIADLSKNIASQLKKAITKNPLANLNKSRTESDIFKNYLLTHGAIAIEVDEKWFYKDSKIASDTIKLFCYNDFFKYLDEHHYKVKTLQAQNAREQWGKNLQNILFAEAVTNNIMLFNTDMGAALMRALSQPKEMLYGKVSGKTIAFKRAPTAEELEKAKEKEKNSPINKTKPIIDKKDENAPKSENKLASMSIASGSIKLMISPAKGEVTLFDFIFPKPDDKLRHITMTYEDTDGVEKIVDFGSFYLNLSAKAWGFAGASLLMSGEVSLGINKNQLSLKNLYESSSKDVSGKVDLFLGAQAGINLFGALKWMPPPDSQKGTEFIKIEDQEYRTLANLEVSAAIAAGMGLTGSIGFGLHGGRLYFTCKMALVWGVGSKESIAFQIDYSSLGEICLMLGRMLRDMKYGIMDFVTTEAFAYITLVYTIILLLGGIFLATATLAIVCGSVIFLYTFSELKEIYEEITNNDNANIIAQRIINPVFRDDLKKWIKTVPPESLGSLFYALTRFQKGNNIIFADEEIRKNQQEAIVTILGWLIENEPNKQSFSATNPNTTQLLFEKAISRMNKYGEKDNDPKSAYCRHKAGLDIFMDYESSLSKEKKKDLISDYHDYIDMLGSHINPYCKIVDDDSFLGGLIEGNGGGKQTVWRYIKKE